MRNYWSLRSSDVFVGLIVLSQTAFAQFSKPDSLMPLGKAGAMEYLFPIQPGKTAMLNGTMGELRSSHFHGGIDINTVTIGYAVRCANDGYVARATVSTGGYGKAVYIRHKDGNTTLYGHLDQFQGALGDYVRQERYRRKQSEIDIAFTPNQFPVKRGDTIAMSGNTGSSGGPHLHFELRSPQDEAINPMVLDFPEVQDHVPPLVQKLALKTLDINSRVNDQFGRFEFHLSRNGQDFVLHQPILATGRIGIEIQAYDKQENSRFKCGINSLEVWADGEKVFAQTIDKINFRESRNILAVMDFKVMETKGTRFNKLYVDDGNRLPYYSGTTLRKGIQMKDKDVVLEVRLTDYHGNTSSLNFTLQPTPLAKSLEFLEPATKPFVADLQENVLTFTTLPCSAGEETLEVFSKGVSHKMSPAYSGKQKNVFLIDLINVLPDSIRSCGGTWISDFKDRIPSGTKYKYFSELVEVEFNSQSLYDTMYLTTAHDSTEVETFTIGQRTVPLFLPVRISIKPLKEYMMAKNLGLYRREGDGFAYVNSAWKNGKINFSTLSLGDFSLLKDTIPPQIKPVSLNGVAARLRIRDDLSGISYFEANIDGKWLLMNYDYKSGIVYSERLDRSKLIKGDFELKIVDNAGNETIFRQRIP